MRAPAHRPLPLRPRRHVVEDAPSTPHRPSTRRIVIALFLTTAVVVAAVSFGGGDDSGGRSSRPADGSNYRVRSGDTILSVADLHAISPERLMDANDLTLSDSLDPGSRLLVPDPPSEGRTPPDELLADDDKRTYTPIFERVEAEYDLPDGLLEALAWDQSAWVNALVSDDDRVGLGQLRPDIVTFLRRDVVDGALDPTVPEDNVELTGAYLDHLLTGSDGDRAAALAGFYLGLEGPAGGTWDLDIVSFVSRLLALAPDFIALTPPPPTSTTTTVDSTGATS